MIVRLFAVLLCLMPLLAFSQTGPDENSRLHYRLIRFSITDDQLRQGSVIEIASGTYTTANDFAANIVVSQACKSKRTVLEVPYFGTAYTWRVVTAGKNAGAIFHHFSTEKAPYVDTTRTRITVVTAATTHQDAFFFVDRSRTLYNMEGRPVWYLPTQGGVMEENAAARDLKITPQGTITFINNDRIFEIDWDARVLWTGPNTGKIAGDSIEHYHHEFTRLNNGHYMVLGNEYVELERDITAPLPAPPETAPIDGLLPPGKNMPPAGMAPPAMMAGKGMMTQDGKKFRCYFGTIIEYDAEGNVVWSWKSFPNFNATELHNRKVVLPVDPHANSFYFDEQRKYVYVSFKNASQIVKVAYPSGKVVATYGKHYVGMRRDTTKGLFCDQHSVRISSKGYIYVFNNNLCNLDKPFNVPMFKEPTTAGTLTTVWQYDCPIDWSQMKNNQRPPITTGGNVMELPDRSLFISSCTPFSNLYLVSEDQKLLWSATAEAWNEKSVKWDPAPQYRASIVNDRNTLEKLIWGSQ